MILPGDMTTLGAWVSRAQSPGSTVTRGCAQIPGVKSGLTPVQLRSTATQGAQLYDQGDSQTDLQNDGDFPARNVSD